MVALSRCKIRVSERLRPRRQSSSQDLAPGLKEFSCGLLNFRAYPSDRQIASGQTLTMEELIRYHYIKDTMTADVRRSRGRTADDLSNKLYRTLPNHSQGVLR